MIDILLSTYNGEKYLSELLDSLLNQSYSEWKLWIRDDGSSDSTVRILDNYRRSYPNRINLIQSPAGNIGATKSFEILLRQTLSEYIMFCDQDDIWLPDKIKITFEAFRNLEQHYPDKPLMVFTDLLLCDSDRHILHSSFIRYQNMNPLAVHNPWSSMAMSVAPGCTMMINRKAVAVCLPIPAFLVHDHWIVNNIAFHGKCEFVDIPTICYRIHGDNCIGINNIDKKYLFSKIKNILQTRTHYVKDMKTYPFHVNIIRVLSYKFKFNLYRLLGFRLYK